MNKYSNIQILVNKLTENDALRTFYTLLLMCENEEEKRLVDARFWMAFQVLADHEKASLKADFKETVKKIPLLTEDLLVRVKDYKVFLTTKQAA